jgi:integrase
MQSKPNQDPLRERVERGIYKRKTRGGELRYEVAYLDSDGRQRWRTVANLKEARNLRADLVSKVNRGERVAPSRLTLREYADKWLDDHEAKLRSSTRARYSTNLRLHVLPRLGRLRVGEVTVDDVARLVTELEAEGKAGWTIRGCLVVLGRVLGHAERHGVIASNPVRKLERGERPKVERREFPSLDLEAVGKLIANTPTRYRTLVAVSALTGIRQSEALGLRWQDVDVKAGIVRVRCQLDRSGKLVEPKTQAAKRDIPIPPSLGRMLAEHRLGSRYSSEADFVFCSSAGTPLGHRNIVRRGLEPALAAAELPKLTWHDLRHVAASALIAQGAIVSYLSRVLGHASPAITLSVYAHEFARAEHAERTRDRMEEAFGRLLS